MSAEYDRVRALFPASLPCGQWLPLQNGFEGLVTDRGAYRLRRRVTFQGLTRHAVYRLTRGAGLAFQGYAHIPTPEIPT